MNVVDYVAKRSPHQDILDQILNQKKSIVTTCVLESSSATGEMFVDALNKNNYDEDDYCAGDEVYLSENDMIEEYVDNFADLEPINPLAPVSVHCINNDVIYVEPESTEPPPVKKIRLDNQKAPIVNPSTSLRKINSNKRTAGNAMSTIISMQEQRFEYEALRLDKKIEMKKNDSKYREKIKKFKN